MKLTAFIMLTFSLLMSNAGYAKGAVARHVSSMAELQSAMSQARPGTEIRIMPGRYPPAKITNIAAQGDVLVTSADRADPAILQSLVLQNISGFTLRNLMFEGPSAGLGYKLYVVRGKNLKLDQLKFRGGQGAVDPAVQAALMVRDSDDMEISDSAFEYFRNGIAMLNVHRILVRDNRLRFLQTDAIRGGGVSDVTIAGNLAISFSPAPGDHPDGVQFWTRNQNAAARNIVIKDNLIARGGGAPVQGIFLRDGSNAMPFENVEISGNMVLGAMYNGIAVNGVMDARLLDNDIVPMPDQKSWLRVDNGQKILVKANRAAQYLYKNSSAIVEDKNQFTKPYSGSQARKIADWIDRKQLGEDQRKKMMEFLDMAR